MSKTVVFFLQGGIGKHTAATAVAENISKNFPDRKLIVICPYPEVFLNNSNVVGSITNASAAFDNGFSSIGAYHENNAKYL